MIGLDAAISRKEIENSFVRLRTFGCVSHRVCRADAVEAHGRRLASGEKVTLHDVIEEWEQAHAQKGCPHAG